MEEQKVFIRNDCSCNHTVFTWAFFSNSKPIYLIIYISTHAPVLIIFMLSTKQTQVVCLVLFQFIFNWRIPAEKPSRGQSGKEMTATMGSNGSAATKGIPATDKYSFPVFERQFPMYPNTWCVSNLKPTIQNFCKCSELHENEHRTILLTAVSDPGTCKMA